MLRIGLESGVDQQAAKQIRPSQTGLSRACHERAICRVHLLCAGGHANGDRTGELQRLLHFWLTKYELVGSQENTLAVVLRTKRFLIFIDRLQ